MARYQQCATCVMVLKLPRLKCDGSLAITLFIFSLHIFIHMDSFRCLIP